MNNYVDWVFGIRSSHNFILCGIPGLFYIFDVLQFLVCRLFWNLWHICGKFCCFGRKCCLFWNLWPILLHCTLPHFHLPALLKFCTFDALPEILKILISEAMRRENLISYPWRKVNFRWQSSRLLVFWSCVKPSHIQAQHLFVSTVHR